MEKISLVTLYISSLLLILSCSANKGFVASNATYMNWIGGQPGLSGVNFNFTVIGDFSHIERLDSIYINGVKANSFEKFVRNDTVFFSVKITDISNLHNGSVKNIDNNESSKRGYIPEIAYLYFSDIDSKVLTLKVDNFIKKRTAFYR